MLGTLGALLGAGLGAGCMVGFTMLTNIRSPLGVGIGLLTGLGAKLLYRGTGSALGFISGAIGAAASVGTVFFLYQSFPILGAISVVLSICFAYWMASD